MSVLGTTYPDPFGAILNTGFERFNSPTGINGLVRVEGGQLEILAVDATKPGTGQFRKFMKQCKQEYEAIIVWEVWNKGLEQVLVRYGFTPHAGIEPLTQEPLTGMRWDAGGEV